LLATDSVYRFLEVEGYNPAATTPPLEHSSTPALHAGMPPMRHLVPSRLGYYIRQGRHAMTADDWRVFMDFADRNWRK
jgi:hypothetical protein